MRMPRNPVVAAGAEPPKAPAKGTSVRTGATKKNTISKLQEVDPFVENTHENEANKTTEEVVNTGNLFDDDGEANKGLSDNLGVPEELDDNSPRFNLKDSGKG